MTVAAACIDHQQPFPTVKHRMKIKGCEIPYLVIRKNERVSYDDILSSCSVEYHYLGNIIRGERFATAVEI